MHEVRLWNAEGVLAIILRPSGVTYTNQTGGMLCWQPSAEGVLVPFNGDNLPEQFEQSLAYELRSLLWDVSRLDAEFADKLDAIFGASINTRMARVDRSRLADSHESWIYVDLDEPEDALIAGFGRCKAVLTWSNSD